MRVLIFGGNGMVGHKLCQVLSTSMEVWATFRFAREGFEFLPMDRMIPDVNVMGKVGVVKSVLDLVKPDVVINAAGIIRQRNESSEDFTSVNGYFPILLERFCTDRNIRMIQISTDCVFSGTKGNYAESDEPDPPDNYGRSKFLGECSRPALTLRTSLIGWEINYFNSLLSWFAMQRGKKIKGYYRAIFNGLSTSVFSNLISEIIWNHPNLSGLYHVGGNPISKYALLVLLRDYLGWSDITIDSDQSVIYDRTLNTTRFTVHTGWYAPDWEVMLQNLAEEWKHYQKYYII